MRRHRSLATDDIGADAAASAARPTVLVVYGPTNPAKIERHVGPLAAVADPTIICFGDADPIPGINYRTVPTFGVRLVGLCLLVVAGVLEAIRGDYDAIVSFSLFPHGIAALIGGWLSRTPVHLGVLGIDLDHHARASYAPVVAWLLRRFDAVSVPGSAHRDQLHRLGVSQARTAVLANAIDVSRFTPGRAPGGRYDAVWVGRLDAEKNPLAFVDALARLRDDGHPVRAAMVGDGPLANAVRARIDAFDLAPDIDLAGWVSDPVDYYRRADAFVLTSHRDALPLSLIESMACGVVPIVPDVGNVRDVVTDGENGLVVEAADASQVAAGLQRLVTDHQFRSSLSTDGSDVRAAYSYEAASEDWETILDILAQPSPANGPRDRVVVA